MSRTHKDRDVYYSMFCGHSVREQRRKAHQDHVFAHLVGFYQQYEEDECIVDRESEVGKFALKVLGA
jgi:hypothetical protein